MEKRLQWILIGTSVFWGGMLGVLLIIGRYEYLDGILAGGSLGLGSFALSNWLVQRMGAEVEHPIKLILIMALKHLVVLGGAILFILVLGVSLFGFALGFACLPLAVAVESLFGPGRPAKTD